MLVTKIILIMVSTVSYNCHGLGPGKMDYIAKICKNHQFILIQEHWLISENLGIFSSEIPGFSAHGISALDSNELLRGRPNGGCSISWNSKLMCKVTPVESGNSRVCAVIVDFSGLKLLLVNFYLPIDTYHDQNNLLEYNHALNSASGIAGNLDIDYVIYGSD